MAPVRKKHIEVEDEVLEGTNVNTPLIQKLLEKQLEHSLLISDLKNQLSDTNNTVKKILTYIENDHSTGQKGIVARVLDIEKVVDDHERFKNNLDGKMWGVALIVGILASILSFIGTKLIDK